MASSTLGTGFFQPQARPGGVTIATERLAEEIGPFMKDYLEREAALATLRTEGFRDEETGELVLDPVTGEPIDPGGYKAFTGPTIAEFTPEQLEAQRGLAGLAGFDISVDPTTGERTVTQTGPGITADRFAEAEALIRGQPEEFTGDVAEKFMSPFQQAVVDIEKREAQQKFEQEVLPKVQAAAIQSGSFGGSRGALLESEALRGQGQLLSDIQRKGSQAAYDRGLKAFEMQKGREAATAQGLTGLATGEFGQRAKELSGIERVGALQQQQTQTALDEAYKEFLEEQAFPESVLDRMQAAAFGFPAMRQEVRQSPTQFGPSTFANLASTVGSIGAGVGSLFGQLGGQRAAAKPAVRKRGGLVSRRDGGLVPLVRRQTNAQVINAEDDVLPSLNIQHLQRVLNPDESPQARFQRAIGAKEEARKEAAIQRKLLEDKYAQLGKKQSAMFTREQADIDQVTPMSRLWIAMMNMNQKPEEGWEFAPLGANLKGTAKSLLQSEKDLKTRQLALDQKRDAAAIESFKSGIGRDKESIERRLSEADEDIDLLKQEQTFSQAERTGKREDEKLDLAKLSQQTNADLKRQELSILDDTQLNKLKIARLDRIRKEKKDNIEFQIKLANLNVAIAELEAKMGKEQAKILNSQDFKELLASGDFKLAEEAALRVGVDSETLAYLRQILNQNISGEIKQRIINRGKKNETPVFNIESNIKSVDEAIKNIRAGL